MGPVHLLTVAGRKSGTPQTTPVSPVSYDGQRWLVAGWPDADWVKNLRASGRATLTKGMQAEEVNRGRGSAPGSRTRRAGVCS